MDSTQLETYPDAIRRLEGLGMMPDRPPGLEVMREGLERLELSIDPARVIVIAGTNGKGSVAASLEALLLSTGARTGLYTSPHLIDTTERVRIAGRDLTQAEFMRALAQVERLTHGMRLPLSHFELLTLIAVWVFHSGEGLPAVDWAIYEVGLGGTWDATNAIPHDHCVITSLSMDHENLLGRTLEEVAANKFGIIPDRRGSVPARVVHARFAPELAALAEQVKAKTGSEWIAVPDQGTLHVAHLGTDPDFSLETPWGRAPLKLAGERGADNTLIALTAFSALGFEPGTGLSALSNVRWPGRMERVDASPLTLAHVYLSGDHNPDGVRSLLELLPHYPRKHLHILAGIGRDKDAENILGPLFKLEKSSLYLTVTPFRGRTLEEYGDWPERASGSWNEPREAFLQVCRRAGACDLVLVTGSLYLVGEIRGLLTASRGAKK